MDSVTQKFLAARKRREIRTERVEIEASMPQRVAALEHQVAVMAKAILDINASAIKPIDIIEAIDLMKAKGK